MTDLLERLRALIAEQLPLPAAGDTPLRHRRLMEVGREDLSLARLAEAHWDALAILAEAEREPTQGAIYGVWASEIPGQSFTLEEKGAQCIINGKKRFCSGVGIVNRVLMSVGQGLLLEVNLGDPAGKIEFDESQWKTSAFAATRTATVTFNLPRFPISSIVGRNDWYLERPGFWHGACGPASCWAGGAAGLLDYAMTQKRLDPHSLAHLGAIHAEVWALRAYLETAGREIDLDPRGAKAARARALTLRHLVEQACTDVLRRLARAYGPHPLAMNEMVSRRYSELDLYLRQSHAERDLEALGRCVMEGHNVSECGYAFC
jgi:alkylation response protein AidB-like acyl-CoA dehydrogenase